MAANFHVLEIDRIVEESKMTKEYHKNYLNTFKDFDDKLWQKKILGTLASRVIISAVIKKELYSHHKNHKTFIFAHERQLERMYRYGVLS